MNWDLQNSVTFCKVNETYGCFSNMNGEYPYTIANVYIKSNAHLYQARRFPTQPVWQREILEAPNGFAAKLKAKKDGRRRHHSRPDWPAIQLDVMRLCLNWKVSRGPNCEEIKRLLRSTKDKPIVELSKRDQFWGVLSTGVGDNWLGRLWMELRAGDECPTVSNLNLVLLEKTLNNES